jgi:hypothetical protein
MPASRSNPAGRLGCGAIGNQVKPAIAGPCSVGMPATIKVCMQSYPQVSVAGYL